MGINSGTAKPNGTHLAWASRKQRHHELEAPPPYSWRKRATPLQGRAAVALWLLCACVVVLWARLATFSHLICKKVKTDRGLGLQNGWLIHIHNRKGITEPQTYYWMSIIIRVWGWWTFAHIYVWVLLWRDMIMNTTGAGRVVFT